MRGAAACAAVMLAITAWAVDAATCSVSAVALALGSYDPLRASHTDSTGNIAVTCSGTPGEVVAYTVSLSPGSGMYAQRTMRSQHGAALVYNIYTTPARVTVWGDGTAGSLAVSDAFRLTGPVTTRNYPTYGRVFSRQKALTGAYADSIVVTLAF